MFEDIRDCISIQEFLDASKSFVPIEQFKEHEIYLRRPQNFPSFDLHSDLWEVVRKDIWNEALQDKFVARFFRSKLKNIKAHGEKLIWYSWFDGHREAADEETIEKTFKYLTYLSSRYGRFIKSMEKGEIDNGIYAPLNWKNPYPSSHEEITTFLKSVGFHKRDGYKFLYSFDFPSTLRNSSGYLKFVAELEGRVGERQDTIRSPMNNEYDEDLITPIKLANRSHNAIDIQINSALKDIDLGARNGMPFEEIANLVWDQLVKNKDVSPFDGYDPEKRALNIEEEVSIARKNLTKTALGKRLKRRLERSQSGKR